MAFSACAYQPEIERPGAADAGNSTGPRPTATGPGSPAPSYSAAGCPVDDRTFCERAAFLANALVLGDADAVFDLSRRVALTCAEVDASLFEQCEQDRWLRGYMVGTYRGEFFVVPPNDYRENLGFFVEAIDEEYSDELGGPEMRILGVSTCGSGSDTSHHLVYTAGLGDPESTLPGDRFLGTYELTQEENVWAIGVAYVGIYTDWQLELDDPLTQIACADVQPWPRDGGS